MDMLRMEDVRFGLGASNGKSSDELLVDANLNVAAGEVVLVVGESGSGKSSLLDLLAGFARPSNGTIEMMGRDLSRLRASSLRRLRRRLAVIEELPNHLDDRSALDNVALALEVEGLGRSEIRSRSVEALAMVGLGERLDVTAAQLSRSERLWLAAARALARKPAVVLADEPWRDLDELGRDRFCDVIDSLAANGAACLVTTSDHHNVELAELWNWTVSELRSGQIVPFHEFAVCSEVELERINTPTAAAQAAPEKTGLADVFPFPFPFAANQAQPPLSLRASHP